MIEAQVYVSSKANGADGIGLFMGSSSTTPQNISYSGDTGGGFGVFFSEFTGNSKGAQAVYIFAGTTVTSYFANYTLNTGNFSNVYKVYYRYVSSSEIYITAYINNCFIAQVNVGGIGYSPAGSNCGISATTGGSSAYHLLKSIKISPNYDLVSPSSILF